MAARNPIVFLLLLLAALALALSGRAAWAQPAPRATDAEVQARAHFKQATVHFNKQEFREALAEYKQSLERYKTRGAMASVADCLRALGQYDDALDQYEALRREYPVLPPEMEAKVAPAMEELQGHVGTLVVAGDAPAGAVLFVDDRKRGTLPLPPLRLSVGSHSVRVEKEGFEPIVATGVVVEPAREKVAELKAKNRQGLLRVSEKHNWVLDVELDGAVVGKTPWEKLVPVGDHEVRLHGFVRVDAPEEEDAPGSVGAAETALDRTEMASSKSTVAVRLYEATSIGPGAKDLDASLRIEASPADAAVAIDGKVVAHGRWEGRLPLGAHTVGITAEGFVPAKKEVQLVRRKQQEIRIDLGRVPKVSAWGPKRSAAVGVAYGLGAAGLALTAITGPVALVTMGEVRSHCKYPLCPTTQMAAANKASALATAATVGVVVGGVGVAAGTLLVIGYRPDEGRPQGPKVAWGARVGIGRFEVEGRF